MSLSAEVEGEYYKLLVLHVDRQGRSGPIIYDSLAATVEHAT